MLISCLGFVGSACLLAQYTSVMGFLEQSLNLVNNFPRVVRVELLHRGKRDLGKNFLATTDHSVL